MCVSEGKPYPLGATADPNGANFAVFSAHATGVDVCIFDGPEGPEIDRFELPEYTDEVFHGHVAGVGPGSFYGFRAYGPFEPEPATVSIRTSFCSTLTRAPTPASSCGIRRCSATRSAPRETT